jgi:alanyl-tRNA synthetase
VKLVDGSRDALIAAGAKGLLVAAVDPAHRLPTQRHHTATHLLHAALRHTLGTHVRQAGSLVAPDRLRFDYTHFEAANDEQLARIEALIGEWLLRNREVTWEIMPIDQAKALGAMALFGEKYGSEVRMVTVEGAEEADIPTSRELCGGTHVERTGDIGAFVLVSDAAIASGVRRIEALCGHEALRWLRDRSALLERIAASLQTSPEKLPEQIERLRGEVVELRKAQAEQLRSGLASELLKLRGEAAYVSGAHVLVKDIGELTDATSLRDAVDAVLRPALGTGAAVLAVHSGGKITFVAAVTDDLVAAKTLNASDLVKKVAQVTGGSGGGKPHLALAGGKDAAKLNAALAEARRLIGEALGG